MGQGVGAHVQVAAGGGGWSDDFNKTVAVKVCTSVGGKCGEVQVELKQTIVCPDILQQVTKNQPLSAWSPMPHTKATHTPVAFLHPYTFAGH